MWKNNTLICLNYLRSPYLRHCMSWCRKIKHEYIYPQILSMYERLFLKKITSGNLFGRNVKNTCIFLIQSLNVVLIFKQHERNNEHLNLMCLVTDLKKRIWCDNNNQIERERERGTDRQTDRSSFYVISGEFSQRQDIWSIVILHYP